MLALQQTTAVPGTPWQWVVLAFSVLGWTLAVVFVLRILARGGSPASTLMWVVVILVLPWVGMGLYYLFPRRLQRRRLRHLRQKQERWRGELRGAVRGADAVPGAETAAEGDAADATPLRRLLRGLAVDAVSDGNAVRWLPDGSGFFASAALAIEQARTCVHLEVYIFRADSTGLAFLDLLVAAARRGVAVRLLYDSFGSFGLKAHHLAELRAAGGQTAAFLPLLWKRRPFTVNLRNHRKMLIVDGAVAFVGGRNIGTEYASDRLGRQSAWLDAMVQVEGPAVADLHQVFAEDWFYATDQELTEPGSLRPPVRAGTDCVGVVGSGPDRDVQVLWYTVFQAINSARERLDLSTPYLVPPPTLLFALAVAAARGVRVRIFTNGAASEAVVLHHAQRSYYRELLRAGIELWETTVDYNHAKVLVVDERTVLVGSANMDMRSAHLNFEIAVVLPDSPALAQQVLATLATRCERCRRITRQDLSPARLRRIVDGFCRLLSPLL